MNRAARSERPDVLIEQAAAFSGAEDEARNADRLAQQTEELDTLVKHAIDGFTGKSGIMPPKGGNPALTDEQIKATVSWMVDQVK